MSKLIEKQVKNLIVKHYGKGRRFKSRGWEQCGQELESIVRREQDKVKGKGLHYAVECDRVADIDNQYQKEYERYFKVGSMYAWVNGNSLLKELLEKVAQ